jgi:hypothetical protein
MLSSAAVLQHHQHPTYPAMDALVNLLLCGACLGLLVLKRT